MIGDIDVKTLIPQREPIIMLDAFYWATETEAETGLTVADDNLFADNGYISELGIVEHIAQSASALAGYWALQKGMSTPIGYIGEIKQCHIYFRPRIGDVLRTRIVIISEALGVSLLAAETTANGQIVIRCQMKIFIKQ